MSCSASSAATVNSDCRPRRDVDLAHLRPPPDTLGRRSRSSFEVAAQGVDRDVQPPQQSSDEAVRRLDEGQQQVLAIDFLVPVAHCRGLGRLQGFLGLLGHLVGIHRSRPRSGKGQSLRGSKLDVSASSFSSRSSSSVSSGGTTILISANRSPVAALASRVALAGQADLAAARRARWDLDRHRAVERGTEAVPPRAASHGVTASVGEEVAVLEAQAGAPGVGP